MNKTLSLNLFLQYIDKMGKIDRKQALSEIMLVALLKIFKKSSVYLRSADKSKVEFLLKNLNELEINSAYNVFLKSNKIDKLQSISDKIIEEVKMDYMKTQFEALSQKDKTLLCEKYPELKNLVNLVTI